jgi:hypothetical protein
MSQIYRNSDSTLIKICTKYIIFVNVEKCFLWILFLNNRIGIERRNFRLDSKIPI